MSATMIWVFFGLMALAVPVAHAMLGGVAAALWLDGKPMAVIAQRLYSPTQSFPMLAIPFFILAGNLMMSGRFGVYLINIARLLVGHMKGGLGQVSIIGSVMFGGVSGSAVADASALGNALIPVQKQAGYPGGFAAAINAASSTVSVLIPPSIPLILFGLVSNTSIVDLFVAGILPGLMLGVGMFAAVWWVARRKNLPRAPLEGGFAAFKSQVFAAIPAFLMPVFIIGTLRFGVATPTEVSVMAVAYALLVSGLIYRDLTPRIICGTGGQRDDDRGGDVDHHGLLHDPMGADGGPRAAGSGALGGPDDPRALDGDPGVEPCDAGRGRVSGSAGGGAAAGAALRDDRAGHRA